jgi:hypothetical protein
MNTNAEWKRGQVQGYGESQARRVVMVMVMAPVTRIARRQYLRIEANRSLCCCDGLKWNGDI